MDEVREFCRRVLGPGPAAVQAAEEALLAGTADRVELLAAAGRACRTRTAADAKRAAAGAESTAVAGAASTAVPGAGLTAAAGAESLAEAVARELAQASAAVPDRQREALALRELLGLSHEQIARVIGIEPAAVGPLLARARLRFRAELRRSVPESSSCPQRDQALRLLTLRHDREQVAVEDESWLLSHLGECRDCQRAHAAMLEASACYRAWPAEAGDAVPGGAR